MLALITLIVGIGIGWLLRGSSATPETAAANAPLRPRRSFQVPSFNQPTGRLSSDAVNKAAAPMLAQLQQRPNDADLLAKIGNLYYDSQIYPQAIEYYQRVAEDASRRIPTSAPTWAPRCGTAATPTAL